MSSLANTQPTVQQSTANLQQVMGTNANATAHGKENTMQHGITQNNIYYALFTRLFYELRTKAKVATNALGLRLNDLTGTIVKQLKTNYDTAYTAAVNGNAAINFPSYAHTPGAGANAQPLNQFRAAMNPPPAATEFKEANSRICTALQGLMTEEQITVHCSPTTIVQNANGMELISLLLNEYTEISIKDREKERMELSSFKAHASETITSMMRRLQSLHVKLVLQRLHVIPAREFANRFIAQLNPENAKFANLIPVLNTWLQNNPNILNLATFATFVKTTITNANLNMLMPVNTKPITKSQDPSAMTASKISSDTKDYKYEMSDLTKDFCNSNINDNIWENIKNQDNGRQLIAEIMKVRKQSNYRSQRMNYDRDASYSKNEWSKVRRNNSSKRNSGNRNRNRNNGRNRDRNNRYYNDRNYRNDNDNDSNNYREDRRDDRRNNNDHNNRRDDRSRSRRDQEHDQRTRNRRDLHEKSYHAAYNSGYSSSDGDSDSFSAFIASVTLNCNDKVQWPPLPLNSDTSTSEENNLDDDTSTSDGDDDLVATNYHDNLPELVEASDDDSNDTTARTKRFTADVAKSSLHANGTANTCKPRWADMADIEEERFEQPEPILRGETELISTTPNEVTAYPAEQPTSGKGRMMIVDSGSTINIEYNPDHLTHLVSIKKGNQPSVKGIGGKNKLTHHGRWDAAPKLNVYLCKNLDIALLSVKELTKQYGGEIAFSTNKATYISKHGRRKVIAHKDKTSGQYVVDEAKLKELVTLLTAPLENQASYPAQFDTGHPPIRNMPMNKKDDATIILHQQLQHPSREKMMTMFQQGKFNDIPGITMNAIKNLTCSTCIGGNLKKSPFASRTIQQRKEQSRKHKLGQRLNADISGKHPESFEYHYKYYLLVYDTATRLVSVKLMKDKKQVTARFREIFNEIKSLKPEVNFGKIKLDEETVFKSKETRKLFTQYDLTPVWAVVDQHESNGAAEVMIRVINNRIRKLLDASKLPSPYWAFALQVAVDAINREPNSLLPNKASPMEYITGKQDNLLPTLVPFGAQCMFYIPKYQKENGTFEANTVPGIILGPTPGNKALQILDLSTGNIKRRRDTITQPDLRHLTKDRIALAVNGRNLMDTSSNTPENMQEAHKFETAKYTPTTKEMPVKESTSITKEMPVKEITSTTKAIPQISDLNKKVGRTPLDNNGNKKTWDGRSGKYVSMSNEIKSPSYTPNRTEFVERIIGNNTPPRAQQPIIHNTAKYSASTNTRSKKKLELRLQKEKEFIVDPQSFAILNDMSTEEAKQAYKATIANLHGKDLPPIPSSLRKALEDPEWQAATTKEMTKYITYGTFSADPTKIKQRLEAGAKVVQLVDVLDIKTHANGAYDKHKVRFCANGKLEHKHNAHRNPSSPVVDTAAHSMIVALSVFEGWTNYVADCENAYLNVTEDQPRLVRVSQAFMDIFVSLGFHNPNNSLILAVQTGLYGYDDTGKNYQKLVGQVLTKVGFNQCPDDMCIWKYTEKDTIIITSFHVDDFHFTTNNDTRFLHVFKQIQQYFAFNKFEEMNSFLGLSYTKAPSGINIGTEALINVAARAVNVTNAPPLYHPWKCKDEITPETSSPEEVAEYKSSIDYSSVLGLASYVCQRARWELQFHTNSLSSKQKDPNVNDYELLVRLIRYLYTTKHYRRYMERPEYDAQGNPFNPRGGRYTLTGMSDADYASRKTDRKSISGSIVYLSHSTLSNSNGIPITARTNAQQTIAQSSNESELVAGNALAKRLVFLNNILKFIAPNPTPAKLFMDNEGAISIAHGVGRTKRSKHIEVKHFYMRELIKNNKLTLHSINTHDNVADAMTKSLGKIKFRKFRESLGIKDPNESTTPYDH